MSLKNKVLGFVLSAAMLSFAGPVSHFGRLVTCGTNICGEKTGSSLPIQLKGPSLYWSTGSPASLFLPGTVDWFALNFDIGVIRAPMAIKYYKPNSQGISVTDGNKGVVSFGYLSTDEPTSAPGTYKALTKAKIKAIVDQAILDDIYVIVDWHSHNAESEVNEAKVFFAEMATEYKDVPNLIWEIYNEPVSSTDQIHGYATQVTKAIRDAKNDNLIIVGSSGYSSVPNQQAQKGLHNTYSNIAYSLHFYAATYAHNSYQNNRASGAPTFVTEWGATEASGDGNISDASSWRTWMDNNKIGGCMWFAGAASEKSAMFPVGAGVANLDNYKANFTGTNTTAGVFAAFMSTNKWTSFVPANHPTAKTIKASIAEGGTKSFSTELSVNGTITSAKASAGTVTFTANSISYTGETISSSDQVSIIYTVEKNGITIQERIMVNVTNRKPVLTPAERTVSYKAITPIALRSLGAVDPESDLPASLTVVNASVSAGSVTFSRDTIYYTPAEGAEAQQTVSLTYSAKNANGTSESSATLTLINNPPTIYVNSSVGSKENTAPVKIGLKAARTGDKDGDELKFKVAYLDPRYPGSVVISDVGDTIIYTPESNTIGVVALLVVVTDGVNDSKVGTVKITLTGAGTQINVTPPTSIPTDIYVEPVAIRVEPSVKNAIGFTMSREGLYLSVPTAGRVIVDMFDMQGHLVKSLVNEQMSAGQHMVNWDNSSIPAGSYVVRMRQGSIIKAQRFINR